MYLKIQVKQGIMQGGVFSGEGQGRDVNEFNSKSNTKPTVQDPHSKYTSVSDREACFSCEISTNMLTSFP